VIKDGTTSITDLGGSSKYSSDMLEGRRWRRVPCQQQLDMGKPILRYEGNPYTK